MTYSRTGMLGVATSRRQATAEIDLGAHPVRGGNRVVEQTVGEYRILLGERAAPDERSAN